jgi:hypothetical protein
LGLVWRLSAKRMVLEFNRLVGRFDTAAELANWEPIAADEGPIGTYVAELAKAGRASR